VAYPPALLPAGSWQAVLSGLDRHFGTDASVDAKSLAELRAFLDSNAGRDRRASAGTPGLRISETDWFRREHRKVPATTWQAFLDATGLRIIDGIGSTEMLHIFIASADDDIRPGSTGRAVPGYVATVLDEHGGEAPAGQEGRLAVRGPTGCRYLDDERQRVYVHGGWNVTGDTYVRDEDGYFWYRARSDDMIVSSGYNIAGPEVEQALLGHPDVVECAVVGVEDPDRGQVVKAYVVLRAGATADAAARRTLQDYVKAAIAPYKYPRLLEFRNALPKTQTGKLQRYKLRQESAHVSGGTARAQ
jgi:2-aminobenzoate-CoA ligase